ncbi:protein IQ-DOMAIN 32 [Eucalyptus grandis]|uniref:protein IQ-DOMAIN 32 n=1 Tax=Eucalyptus grandis TaxID=71139 RepID=UPI00192ED7B8|nr:protein IQ-DOMAIN 32 [Eucalyptus grandis]
MGRSASCFKIITCGSDSADNDDVEASEIKGDKKGWSFRKRSARHRVLSNSAMSETSAPATKEIPESADVNFKAATDSDVPQKVSAIQCADEKPPLLAPVDAKVSEAVDPVKPETVDAAKPETVDAAKPETVDVAKPETVVAAQPETVVAAQPETVVAAQPETVVAAEPETVDRFNVDEATIIFIQATIRSFLAYKALLKLKSVIKLQSAVRGHLVRSHAVGTLRCVQAIVKMQALVRARRARQLTEGMFVEKNADVKQKRDGINLKALEMENANKPSAAYISIEKLLSNRFARQLLNSTPKEKPINIKCDISKSDSTWKWLERWMSAPSAEPSPITGLMTEQQESKENEKLTQENLENSSEVLSRSSDSVLACEEISAPAEKEDNPILPDEAKSKLEECNVIPGEEYIERSGPEKFETFDANESSTERESTPPLICDSSKMEPDSLSDKIEVEIEQPKHSGKRFAPDQLETLGKKQAFGSRKAGNPSFIAAQSKFEELTSTVNSSKSINLSNQDVEPDSNGVPVSSGDTTTQDKAFGLDDNVASNHARVQVGGSECDTELSITSTLDSPDRYDDGNADAVNQANVTEERTCSPDDVKNEICEVKESTAVQLTLSESVSDHPEKGDNVISEQVTSIVAVEPHVDELNLDRSTSDVLGETDSKTVQRTYRSSPEASPRSHITVPESQGTPASQVSVNTKGSRTDNKTRSSNKRKSLSAGKKSPSNMHRDSGTGTPKQLPKDQKNGKRRSSFGSAKPANEQEPRDSSSSNSIPHFMQATESARAKLNSNNSPRSSPDVHDTEFHIKKRHSLPGVNDRQGSPRIQRSTSQAQQGAKANGAQTQERKWLR